MKTKEEILDHLAKTVYTHNARKSIIQWLSLHGVISEKSEAKFAGHVYNRDGVRMTEGLSYEDFEDWLGGYEIEKIENLVDKELQDYYTNLLFTPTFSLTYVSQMADAIEQLGKAVAKEWHIEGTKIIADDFQIGDAVKYMPTPDESTTEYVEAIAHDGDGGMYLCLSNGEYVRPSYCARYKVQGEKRRNLIERLNETL